MVHQVYCSFALHIKQPPVTHLSLSLSFSLLLCNIHGLRIMISTPAQNPCEFLSSFLLHVSIFHKFFHSLFSQVKKFIYEKVEAKHLPLSPFRLEQKFWLQQIQTVSNENLLFKNNVIFFDFVFTTQNFTVTAWSWYLVFTKILALNFHWFWYHPFLHQIKYTYLCFFSSEGID